MRQDLDNHSAAESSCNSAGDDAEVEAAPVCVPCEATKDEVFHKAFISSSLVNAKERKACYQCKGKVEPRHAPRAQGTEADNYDDLTIFKRNWTMEIRTQ